MEYWSENKLQTLQIYLERFPQQQSSIKYNLKEITLFIKI